MRDVIINTAWGIAIAAAAWLMGYIQGGARARKN